MSDENSQPSTPVNALKMAKRKAPCVCHSSVCSIFLDQIVVAWPPRRSFCWHFGRTVHAMCNVHALIYNGITTHIGKELVPEELLTYELVLFLYFSVTSELTHAYQTQRWKRVSSVRTTFADYSPPSRAPHGVRASRLLNLYVLYCSLFWTILLFFKDSERCFQCKIRRYQES